MNRYDPRGFEKWRQMMLGGAVILLLMNILKAADVVDTGLVYAIGLGAGYMLLVFGFGESFRNRRAKQQAAMEAQKEEAQKEDVWPEDDEVSRS